MWRVAWRTLCSPPTTSRVRVRAWCLYGLRADVTKRSLLLPSCALPTAFLSFQQRPHPVSLFRTHCILLRTCSASSHHLCMSSFGQRVMSLFLPPPCRHLLPRQVRGSHQRHGVLCHSEAGLRGGPAVDPAVLLPRGKQTLSCVLHVELLPCEWLGWCSSDLASLGRYQQRSFRSRVGILLDGTVFAFVRGQCRCRPGAGSTLSTTRPWRPTWSACPRTGSGSARVRDVLVCVRYVHVHVHARAPAYAVCMCTCSALARICM
jgi:hypothetical protein